MSNLAHMKHGSLVVSLATSVALSLLCACSSSGEGRGSSTSGGQTAGGSSSGGATTSSGGKSSGGSQDSGGKASTGSGGSSGASSSKGGASAGSVGSGGAAGSTTSSGGAAGGSGGAGGTAGSSVGSGGNGSGGNGDSSSSRAGQSTGGTSASGGSQGGSGGSVSSSGGTRDAGADASTNRDTSSTGPEPFVSGQPPAAAKYFKKGINLGNRLDAPTEGEWGGKVLASDFPFIAKRGFDHVRIPIRFSGHAQTGAPYTIDAAFFSRIDAVVDQALAAKLAVIVDLHHYDDLSANPSAHRERFLGLWSQIASRYKDRPETVAFELLNEPYSQLDNAWNDIVAAAIATVRTTNPRRLLVVDTVFWADPTKLSSLTLPNDANILVAVHMYEPKLFSMQGKSWMGPEYMTTGLIFPGPPPSPVTPVAAASAASWAKQWFDNYNTLPAATNPSGPATITAQMAYVTNYQKAQGRAVYNGEWGPQDGGPMDSRARLVAEMRKQCEQAGVGWAIWEDRTNMKLFDSEAGTWVSQIVDALLP